MTNYRILASAALLGGLACALPALAGDLYVIANSGVNLGVDEIRDVFVGDKQVDGAVKLVPIENAALQKDFLAKVVKLDAAKYTTIWAKKGFRDGLNPPAIKMGDAEVLAAVKSTPGALGYVSSAPPAGVKLLHKY